MHSPTQITLHAQTQRLELSFDDGSRGELSAEFLRVYSPSAEVRGHGAGQEILQTGKRLVRILELEAVGQYAIRIVFDDGHSSGLYSWSFLYEALADQEPMWAEYLGRLAEAKASRDVACPAYQIEIEDR